MIYRNENISIDTAAFVLLLDGEPQPVEPQVFDLLVYLIENRDRVVTRDELLENLWQGRIVSENALNARLKIARKAVGDDGKQQRIIKTIQRRGYQFIAEIAATEPYRGQTQQPPPRTATVAAKPSIVVLRFANHSTQDGQEYFADGITTNVRSCLSRIHALKVMSAMEFECGGKSNLQIAQAFEADYALSGSVQREGDSVRVFAELTDGRSGAIKWSERFDRRGEAVTDIQDDLAMSIVATLWGHRGRIREALRDSLAIKQTRDFDAFDCVLKGIYCKEQFTENESREAQKWFAKAIEIDPLCAEAYAWQALVTLCEMYLRWPVDHEGLERSFTMARRAIEIDPYCESAYMALGWAYNWSGDLKRGFAAFDRAMQINPNNSDLMVFKGEELATSGRFDEGIRLIQQGIDFNKQPPDWYFWHLGLAYFAGEQPVEAIDAFEKMNRQNKDTLIHLVACYANSSRPDHAAQRLAELMQEDPQFRPEQIRDTHCFYSSELQELLLRGLETAMNARTADQKLKIVQA